MSWVTDLFDGLEKFKPWTTVYEYENGLFINGGKIIAKKIPEYKLDDILKKEWENLKEDKKEDGISIKKGTIRNISVLKTTEDKAYNEFLLYQYHKLASRKNLRPLKNTDTNTLLKFISGSDRNFNPSFDSDYSEWKSDFWTGRPLHPIRFRKNIPYGVYFHLPTVLGLQKVAKLSVAEVVKDLKYVSLMAKGNVLSSNILMEDIDKKDKLSPTPVQINSANSINSSMPPPILKNLDDMIDAKDLYSVMISGMVRYKLEDGYKAYINVADWESSYQSQALIIISDECRGKSLTDFYSKSFLDGLKKSLKEKLNDLPRKDWGIKTMEVGLYTVSPHTLVRNIQEHSSDGLYISLENQQPSKNNNDD